MNQSIKLLILQLLLRMISISIVGKYCYHAIFLYLCCPGLNRNVDNVNLFVDSFSLRESLTFNSKLPCLHRCHQTKKSARVILPIVRICSSLKSSCLNEKSGTDFSTYDSDDDVTRNEPSTEYQIFKGKNKWLGGAIDPKDGSIYGIPSNSNDVICLRPSRKWKTISSPSSSSSTLDSVEYRIHTIPLPKGINEGKFKWLRGIISNNFLYGIPAWSNNGILKLDIQKLWENHEERMENGHDLYDDVVSTIPLPESFYNHDEENKPSRWLWHGAALNSNKTAIYCIPSNAHQVLKVDLEQSVCSFLPIPEAPSSTPLDQTNKWYGGILGNDNAIYGIPYSAANVIRIDANTDTVSLLGDYGLNEYNWHGGIKSDINGCIYCFPAHHSHVLKINTDPKPNDEDDVDDVKKEFRLSLVPIHRASYDKDEVTRYKWLGGSLGADGNIYGMPSDASSILR